MEKISTNKLKEDKQILLNQMSIIGDKILRGSLFECFKRCGRKGCKCMKGKGHGPKSYVTINFPKVKPQQDYIPLRYVEQVKEYISNHQQLKKIIEQICVINREILKRREELQ